MENPDKVIVWRITQKCNMNCLFCSYSNEVERKRDTADSKEIMRFIKLLGEYRDKTKQKILISWIGGEPFLYSEIIPLSKELSEIYNINVSTTTNGLLLSSAPLRADVLHYFSEIVFSLDGFSQCHDKIRQYPGHHDKVVENIRNLIRERASSNSALKVKVNTILLRENISSFRDFCQEIVGIGVDELTFNQLGGYDRPEFFQDNRLLPEQVEKFALELPLIQEAFSKAGLIIHGSLEYLNRFISSAENKKISIEECNPGKWFWFINENGYISPCSYTSYEYMLPLSSIQSVEDISNVETVFSELRHSNRSHWCDDCHCTQLFDKFT